MNPWTNIVSWVLVFHIAGIVLWIGGLFYALSVARSGSRDDAPAVKQQRAALAQKAMRALAHPGAAITVLAGGYLFYLLPGVRLAGWLHAKLLLVLILIVFDILVTMRLRQMPERELAPRQLRLFHGSITLVFLLILIMVMIKPF